MFGRGSRVCDSYEKLQNKGNCSTDARISNVYFKFEYDRFINLEGTIISLAVNRIPIELGTIPIRAGLRS